MNRYAALMLSCAAASHAGTALSAPLRPFETSYAVIWRGFTAGITNFTLRQDSGQVWTYVSRNQPRGLFRLVPKTAWTLTSRINVSPDGVRPLLYTATDPDDRTSKGDLHFDWATNRATGVVDGTKVDMPLRPGVQDDLSVQIALIYALSNDQVPTGISLFDVNGIRDYDYARVGAETLHTPVGDVATIIYRSHKANSPRSTRFWCAPEFGFVPVQAEQQNKGDVEWTMKIRSIHRD